MKIALTFNVKKNKYSSDLAEQVDLEFDSPVTIRHIKRALKHNGHEVIYVEADDRAFNKLKKLKNKIDLVFNVAEGLDGDARESQIPLFCEILKIPYTHSTPTINAIKLHKHYCNALLNNFGIRTPQSFLVQKNTPYEVPSNMHFPLFIKPNHEGSSKGVFDKNVVYDQKQLENRLEELFKGYEGDFIVEEYIDGREFTVGVLGNFPPRILPIIEQRFDFMPEGMHKIASFELKWLYEDNLEDIRNAYVCPAILEPALEKEIIETTLKVYNILKVRDCARADYRLSKDGKLYFLEINTLPGINGSKKEICYYVLAGSKAGYSYDELLGEIVNNAAKRYQLSPSV